MAEATDDAILSETWAGLRALRGPSLVGLRVEKAVVGVAFSGVKLSDGSGGVAASPRMADPHPPGQRLKAPPGALRGAPVVSLLEPFPEEPFLRSLAVAALSALSAPLLDGERYRAVYDKDALDVIELKPGMQVVLVGAFHSYIDRIKSLPGLNLKVLELRKDALRPEDMPFYVPAERAAQTIPRADVVVATGLTIVNGTARGLLSLTRPDCFLAVVGPSGSMLPDALFRRHASMVSGCVLTEPDAALELLSQGASARHLYGKCARKINLLPR